MALVPVDKNNWELVTRQVSAALAMGQSYHMEYVDQSGQLQSATISRTQDGHTTVRDPQGNQASFETFIQFARSLQFQNEQVQQMLVQSAQNNGYLTGIIEGHQVLHRVQQQAHQTNLEFTRENTALRSSLAAQESQTAILQNYCNIAIQNLKETTDLKIRSLESIITRQAETIRKHEANYDALLARVSEIHNTPLALQVEFKGLLEKTQDYLKTKIERVQEQGQTQLREKLDDAVKSFKTSMDRLSDEMGRIRSTQGVMDSFIANLSKDDAVEHLATALHDHGCQVQDLHKAISELDNKIQTVSGSVHELQDSFKGISQDKTEFKTLRGELKFLSTQLALAFSRMDSFERSDELNPEPDNMAPEGPWNIPSPRPKSGSNPDMPPAVSFSQKTEFDPLNMKTWRTFLSTSTESDILQGIYNVFFNGSPPPPRTLDLVSPVQQLKEFFLAAMDNPALWEDPASTGRTLAATIYFRVNHAKKKLSEAQFLAAVQRRTYNFSGLDEVYNQANSAYVAKQKSQPPARPGLCYTCNSPNHHAADCPQARYTQRASQRKAITSSPHNAPRSKNTTGGQPS